MAARTCMLTSDMTLKIGDYGLSTSCYPEDYYLGASGISVRWCAPESVFFTQTTIELNQVIFKNFSNKSLYI